MADPQSLINMILNGDRDAFALLVKDHERLVGQIVFRMISNRHDREDLCQEIFIKVYQNLSGFQFQSKLSTWIAKIAYNTCLNYKEKKQVPLYEDQAAEGETVDDCASWNAGPDEWTESRQESVKLCEEIDRLPVIYGTIVSLYHLHQMAYLEISEILNLPVGTVKSYLFRARRMLKELMLARYRGEELCA